MKARGLTKETILSFGAEKRNFPDFRVGDTVEVMQVVREGDKERIQAFKGHVILSRNNGIASTFTVRKIGANSIGVERIFPYYSKNIADIKLVKKGAVRRARLGYLRDKVGKGAKIKDKKQEQSMGAKLAETAVGTKEVCLAA